MLSLFTQVHTAVLSQLILRRSHITIQKKVLDVYAKYGDVQNKDEADNLLVVVETILKLCGVSYKIMKIIVLIFFHSTVLPKEDIKLHVYQCPNSYKLCGNVYENINQCLKGTACGTVSSYNCRNETCSLFVDTVQFYANERMTFLKVNAVIAISHYITF